MQDDVNRGGSLPCGIEPDAWAGGVLLVVRDLFFRVKLEAGLRALGVPYRTAGAGVPEPAPDPPPALVIVDLSDASLAPLDLLRRLAARPGTARLPVIGFASHVDRELREAARRAGCAAVVSRSRISSALAEVLEPFHPRRGGEGLDGRAGDVTFRAP